MVGNTRQISHVSRPVMRGLVEASGLAFRPQSEDQARLGEASIRPRSEASGFRIGMGQSLGLGLSCSWW